MTNTSLFLFIAGAHLLAVMSPGPDFAMVTRQTLAHGRRAGLLTAWGIATGIVVHVSWGLFGLGWLLGKAPVLLEVLRYAGAAFLLWMGSKALRARPAAAASSGAADSAPARRDRHFLIGLATNLLNAKAMLFFVALCSAAITSDTPMALRFALGAWIVLTTGLWFSFVSLTLSHPAVRRRLLAQAHWIDRGMGVILLALGLAMLLGGPLKTG